VDKVIASAAAAVADVPDGATVAFGGFGVLQGWPNALITALRDHGARELTLILNTPGKGPLSTQPLFEAGLVRKVVASFAAYPGTPTPCEDLVRAGRVALEVVPQGTLAERLRAGGAGIPAFYTPVGAGTAAAAGKEQRTVDGRRCVLERALRPDVACVRAHRADRHGNLVYRRAGRSFSPLAAMAARCTIAEVDVVEEPGALDPDVVVTPGPWVDRIVRAGPPLDVATLREMRRAHGRRVASEPRPDAGGLPPDLMARRVALLLRPGEVVNLGLGLPTLVAEHLDPADGIVLHAENGLVGYGPAATPDVEDPDVYDAAGRLVTLPPGAACVDSVTAHALARGGRVTTVVLGAFEVSAAGDLANWQVPASGKGGIGGAMDLVAGGARVVVLAFHATRDGRAKLVRRCGYPLTARRCVREIVTDLARITVEPEGFVLRELAPGVALDDVRRRTGARFVVAPDCRTMPFERE